MKEQQAVDAVVLACINTWPETVKKATEAGRTFCLIGYFDIPDSEHSTFRAALLPLLEDIESKGAQALEFRPNLDGVYDISGHNIVAYVQHPWYAPVPQGQDTPKPREILLLTNEYLRTRDVTEDIDPQELVHGTAFPQSEVPTFHTHVKGDHIVGAVGVSWHEPRLK